MFCKALLRLAYLRCRQYVRNPTATTVSPAKTAEPIELPIGLWTRVGPINHVFGWGPDPPGYTLIKLLI